MKSTFLPKNYIASYFDKIFFKWELIFRFFALCRSSSFRGGCCCWAIYIWKAVRSAFLGGINPNAHSQRNFDPVTSFYGANNWMIMEKYDPSLSADAYFTSTTTLELLWVPRFEFISINNHRIWYSAQSVSSPFKIAKIAILNIQSFIFVSDERKVL